MPRHLAQNDGYDVTSSPVDAHRATGLFDGFRGAHGRTLVRFRHAVHSTLSLDLPTMNRTRTLSVALATMATVLSAAPMVAQAVLRPAPSSRATSEVSLSYPRPAGAMAGMAGMAGMTPAPAARAAVPAATPAATPPAAPAKPIVIRVDYGQPHLRGRALHSDSLVPYDKPWRLGANATTTFTTDVDLMLGGATLAKGTYVLYTVPSRAGWKLVVQRNAGQMAMQFSDSLDIARIDLRHTMLTTPMEAFTMWLIPSLEPGLARGELRFAWGTDQLSTTWSVK